MKKRPLWAWLAYLLVLVGLASVALWMTWDLNHHCDLYSGPEEGQEQWSRYAAWTGPAKVLEMQTGSGDGYTFLLAADKALLERLAERFELKAIREAPYSEDFKWPGQPGTSAEHFDTYYHSPVSVDLCEHEGQQREDIPSARRLVQMSSLVLFKDGTMELTVTRCRRNLLYFPAANEETPVIDVSDLRLQPAHPELLLSADQEREAKEKQDTRVMNHYFHLCIILPALYCMAVFACNGLQALLFGLPGKMRGNVVRSLFAHAAWWIAPVFLTYVAVKFFLPLSLVKYTIICWLAACFGWSAEIMLAAPFALPLLAPLFSYIAARIIRNSLKP